MLRDIGVESREDILASATVEGAGVGNQANVFLSLGVVNESSQRKGYVGVPMSFYGFLWIPKTSNEFVTMLRNPYASLGIPKNSQESFGILTNS